MRVKPCGSLGGTGTLDWVVQRLSAMLLALTLLVGVVAIAMHSGEVTFDVWAAWFAPTWVKLVSMVALAALCVHAWVGMWCVATDYLHGALRCLFLGATAVGLLGCLGWGVVILWGL